MIVERAVEALEAGPITVEAITVEALAGEKTAEEAMDEEILVEDVVVLVKETTALEGIHHRHLGGDTPHL